MKLVIIAFTIILIATSQCVFGSNYDKLEFIDAVNTAAIEVHETLAASIFRALQQIVDDAKQAAKHGKGHSNNEVVDFAKSTPAKLYKKLDELESYIPGIHKFLLAIRDSSEKLNVRRDPFKVLHIIEDNGKYIINSRSRGRSLIMHARKNRHLMDKANTIVRNLRKIDEMHRYITKAINVSLDKLTRICNNFIKTGIGSLAPNPTSECALVILQVTKTFANTFQENGLLCVNNILNDFKYSIKETSEPLDRLVEVISSGEISVYLVREILKTLPRISTSFARIYDYSTCQFSGAVKSLFQLVPLIKTLLSKCMNK